MELYTENDSGKALLSLLLREDVFSRLILDAAAVCQAVPEACAMLGFDQRNPHHPYDAWVHTAHAVAYAPAVPMLRLTLLFHDLGKPGTFYLAEDAVGHFNRHEAKGEAIARERLPSLGFDAETVETISLLVLYHDQRIAEDELLRWDAALGRERLLLLLDVKEADARAHADGYKEIQLTKIKALRDKLAEKFLFNQ